MLIQKDYIIVELNPMCGHWYKDCNWITPEFINVEENEITNNLKNVSSEQPLSELSGIGWDMCSLDFTIQCNGKLKRHRTFFRIKDVENTSIKKEVVWRYEIQEAISMLSSLGYELNIMEIQDKITSELKN